MNIVYLILKIVYLIDNSDMISNKTIISTFIKFFTELKYSTICNRNLLNFTFLLKYNYGITSRFTKIFSKFLLKIRKSVEFIIS